MSDLRRELHLARILDQERDRYLAEHPPEPGEPVVVACNAGLKTTFPDDVRTTCSDCGVAIYHRPNQPEGATFVCLECCGKRLDADTPEVRRQFAEVTRRQLERARRELGGN